MLTELLFQKETSKYRSDSHPADIEELGDVNSWHHGSHVTDVYLADISSHECIKKRYPQIASHAFQLLYNFTPILPTLFDQSRSEHTSR